MFEQEINLLIINYLMILWSHSKIIEYMLKKSMIILYFYVDYVGIATYYNSTIIDIKLEKCATTFFKNFQLPELKK